MALDEVGLVWYIALFVGSLCGGVVGSLSGGAGMITMPLLLLSGVSSLQALATNKLQACIGSLTSAAHYYREGMVDLSQSRLYIIIAAVCSGLGALSVQFVSHSFLSKALPFVMICVGVYFLFSPNVSDDDRAKSTNKPMLYLTCALLSVYGGFLGVGIGTFVMAMFVSIAGYGMSKALAHSRWIVFGINIVATLLFIFGGHVLWLLGGLMCVGQIIGASLGARLAIKHGARIIRPVVICMCCILSAQLFIREFV